MSVASVSQPQDNAAQRLSIHQLSMRKVCRYFSVDEAQADLLGLIARVVHLYNHTKKEKPYREIGQHNGLAHFQLIIYAQIHPSQSRLAQWIQDLGCEEDLTTKRVHYLFFFYRQITIKEKEVREIFALTSGQAWRVVQRFSDFRFPPKIARRLFAPQILSSQNRHLVGGVLTHSEVLKQGATVSDTDAVDSLFTRMKFGFRPDASVFALSFLQTKKGVPLTRGMTAEIGLGLVRLGKDLNPDHYPDLLHHFAVISRGEVTHCFGEANKAEQDSDEFDFLDYLHPVDFALVPQLKQSLIRVVYLAVVKDAPFPPLDFCHKNRNEYFHGSDHQLHYDGEALDCSNSFMAAQMVDRLKSFDSLMEAESEKEFVAKLTKVTVSFVFQGKREETLFIDCLEGEFRLPDGSVYWRLHTMWYEVRADYLGLVHKEFGGLVEKTLLGDKDPGSLQHPWPSPADKEKRKEALQKAHKAACKTKKCSHKIRYDVEAEYNQTYLSKDRFLLGDKICPQGIELFDVLHYTPTHLYLYHVKEGFGQKTRDACSQVFNAAQLVHTLRQKGASNIADQFYAEATNYSGKEKYRTQVKQKVKALGKKGFCDLFGKKIVFVYAFADTSDKKEPRLLAKDKGLKTRITPADIVQANAKFKGEGRKIFNALVAAQYLTSKGYLTSKFFAASGATFTLQMVKVDNQRKALYRHLSTFTSQFDSTIAKLELLRLRHELEKLGFDLKICQIPRTDYPQGAASSTGDPQKGYASLDGLPGPGDLPPPPPDLPDLNEEDDFTHGDDTFHICTTRGDGACGMHALLGTKKNGTYVYNAPKPNTAAREHFTKTLRSKYNSVKNEFTICLVGLLKDYLQAPSIHLKTIFDPIKDQIDQLSESVAKISTHETQLKQTQEQQFEAALDVEDEEAQSDLVAQLGVSSLDILREDPRRRNGAFLRNLEPVLKALDGTEEGEQLSQTCESLRKLEDEREAVYKAFVQTPQVLTAYINGCQERYYYFSERELGLAAHLFDKRVAVYGYRHLDQVFDPMRYGNADNEEVVIFHKGLHFSHCERVEVE